MNGDRDGFSPPRTQELGPMSGTIYNSEKNDTLRTPFCQEASLALAIVVVRSGRPLLFLAHPQMPHSMVLLWSYSRSPGRFPCRVDRQRGAAVAVLFCVIRLSSSCFRA